MTAEQWALAAGVVFAGLWSGLLGMLTFVMHRVLAAMDGGEFERFLRAFLPVGRKACFNYVCALRMAIAPIVALVLLWDDRSSMAFVLTAVGLGIVILGGYVVSHMWKEPLYDVMLAWNPEAMPANWAEGRRRYFRSTGSGPQPPGRSSGCSSRHSSPSSDGSPTLTPVVKVLTLLGLLVIGIFSLPVAAFLLDDQGSENWILPVQLGVMAVVGGLVGVGVPGFLAGTTGRRVAVGAAYGVGAALVGLAVFFLLLSGFEGA